MFEDFHKHAHKYIGVPFRHQGRTDRGMDCVGLVVRCAMDCGYDKYKPFAYGRWPRLSVLQGVLKEHFGDPVDRYPQINDVVLMRLWRGAKPSHVGIITTHPNGLGIIHAYGAIRKVKHQPFTDEMMQRVAGVYQWPDM